MTDTNKLKELAELAISGFEWFSGVRLENPVAAFIAAANPQAILGLLERLEKAEQHWANENSNNMALIAEVERLRADTSSMRGSLNAYSKSTKKLVKDGTRAAKERDRLKAENEVLEGLVKKMFEVIAKTDPEGVKQWMAALEGGAK